MDKQAMYRLSYGLFVLTANAGEKDNGCIINTALQVTSEPNRIAITVNKENYTCSLIDKNGEFTVSIISEGANFELFKRFGFQSGRDIDKFEGFDGYKKSEDGAVIVTGGTCAYITAKVFNKVDLGTHVMFFADVVDSEVLSDETPATYAFYQENIKPKREEANANKKTWVCKICGYEYPGENLPPDFVCPICKHPVSDFELI